MNVRKAPQKAAKIVYYHFQFSELIVGPLFTFFSFVSVAAWQRCGATASAPKSTTRNPMCHCLFGFPHYCFRFFPVSLFETLSIKIIMKAITTTCLCVQFTFAQSERVCTRAHVQYPRLFSTLFLSLCTMSSCVVCAECICRWTIVCVCASECQKTANECVGKKRSRFPHCSFHPK